LTTVHQPVRKLAAEALGLLVAEIGTAQRQRRKHADLILEHEITRRQSARPILHGTPSARQASSPS
jgi:LacI family transcriptional regulator